MHREVFRLDFGMRRRLLAVYALGMAVYALIIVALYPTFEHSTGLDNLTKNSPTMAALFGASGSITSPAGWLEVNLYANFFPLVVLLATIGYGASAVAGQDEDGTLAMVTTLPIRRRRITVEKSLAMAAQAVVIVSVSTAFIAIGYAFDITVGVAGMLGASVGVLLLGIDLGLIALVVGAATGRRGIALGAASAVGAISYLVSSLAPVVHWMRPMRFASLFYWSVGNNQLTKGISPSEVAVLAGCAIVLVAVAILAFERLDLH
jgi:ABC-2 type transport system permease protein